MTPLIFAAHLGSDKMVQLLLNNKASVNLRQSTTLRSALWYASNAGNHKVVNTLLEGRADVDLADRVRTRVACPPLLAKCSP